MIREIRRVFSRQQCNNESDLLAFLCKTIVALLALWRFRDHFFQEIAESLFDTFDFICFAVEVNAIDVREEGR